VSLRRGRIGSGTVTALGMVAAAITLLAMGNKLGWNATWRSFGVTPLQPEFFDMHVINDYAACAAAGVDAYAPQACNVDNFNIPSTWLWLGYLGVDGTDSTYLAAIMIALAGVVLTLLVRARPWFAGVAVLAGAISPSVMMGVERGNLDLLIFALVGTAALIYREVIATRSLAAVALLMLGVALKLFPLFCVSLVTRLSKVSITIACIFALIGAAYLAWTFDELALIRRNVPTTFILSYGYKTFFLGFDHVRDEAALSPLNLADTWLPAFMVVICLACAIAVAASSVVREKGWFSIDGTVAGTAFLFGAGIYCGTYLLGSNFDYRLIFLLLCMPQLLDWNLSRRDGRLIEKCLMVTVLAVLWLNGSADGHGTFLLLPQILNWLLFLLLATVLSVNLVQNLRMLRGLTKFGS
jgi:hypothetical protein